QRRKRFVGEKKIAPADNPPERLKIGFRLMPVRLGLSKPWRVETCRRFGRALVRCPTNQPLPQRFPWCPWCRSRRRKRDRRVKVSGGVLRSGCFSSCCVSFLTAASVPLFKFNSRAVKTLGGIICRPKVLFRSSPGKPHRKNIKCGKRDND